MSSLLFYLAENRFLSWIFWLIYWVFIPSSCCSLGVFLLSIKKGEDLDGGTVISTYVMFWSFIILMILNNCWIGYNYCELWILFWSSSKSWTSSTMIRNHLKIKLITTQYKPLHKMLYWGTWSWNLKKGIKRRWK